MIQILAERKNAGAKTLARLRCAERESESQLRAALLRVGGYLGLDERTVIRFTEIVTRRAWSRCGAAQVVEVGNCLLDIAVALKCGQQPGVEATRPRAICVSLPTAAAINAVQLSEPVDSNRRRGGED